MVVDGTLIPTWNWASQGKTLFSGKHKRTGYNHQVICTLSGKLLAITDPAPGARHDVYAYRFHQLERFLDESTLADKGYLGLGLLTPTKRKAGVKMRAAIKKNNRRINRLRSVVKRTIAHIKNWRVLHTGFRRSLGSYSRVFSSGAGADFFRGVEPLMYIPQLIDKNSLGLSIFSKTLLGKNSYLQVSGDQRLLSAHRCACLGASHGFIVSFWKNRVCCRGKR